MKLVLFLLVLLLTLLTFSEAFGGVVREEYKGVNIIAYKCTKCAREIYESRKSK